MSEQALAPESPRPRLSARGALLDLALWTLYFPLRRLLARLPVAWLDALGDLGGDLLFRLKSRDRQALVRFARDLIPAGAPEAEARAVARQGLRVFCKRQIEILCCQRLDAGYVRDNVVFEGLEHLDAALGQGRGVVAVTAHFGPFLLGPMALGLRGYAVTQLTGPRRDARLSPVQARVATERNRMLDAVPLSFLELGNHLKTVFQLLRANTVVVLAFDGREGKDFEPVRFLGRAARFSPGPFRLADKTGAPVLPIFSYREAGGRSRVVIGPALDLPRGADGRLDARAATQAFADLFAAQVAKRPDHFVTTLLNMDRDVRLGIVNTPIFGQEP